ncbi:BamA/TamA family outer membrane protein [Pedobacter sp. SYSU D00535]|uniref:BamA/TamA family outer membrane protein n=1 Tax=Pedobacter sp. SYSU D00535 TaxID=2810308 RepID=UPI001F608F9F|nr:BamA/TamA family outer membrane protein [Pedobacter sp. SYSU D00535]
MPLLAQRKLIDKLTSANGDSTRSGSFLILPSVGYAQETGWEFGIVSLSSFYTDKTDTLTRPSTLGGLAAFTTKKQYNFVLKPDIWSPGNRYHYHVELRYKDFPFNFYGVGDQTREADKDVITQRLIRVAAEAEKLLKRGAYLGLNLSYENYRYTDQQSGGIFETSPSLRDRNGGEVVYIGLSQIVDSRDINTYTTRGTYLKFNYSFIPDLFGGENFTGSLFKFDLRTFKSYNPKTVLGFNLVYNTLQGSNTPFYLMPQLGNDQIMRGYYSGRYRNDNLLAAQTELRYRLIPRFGVAAFAGAGTVYGNRLLRLNNVKPSYGGGIRYFVDPKKGMTLRFDYAFGEKRPGEERQKGFYLSLNEAF